MLTGRAFSGKSTLASAIPSLLPGPWREVAFADPLKTVCREVANVFGVQLSREHFYDPVLKETPLSSPELTTRQIMQYIGTDVLRKYLGENVFVTALVNSILLDGTEDNIIITDVRFPNEAAVKDIIAASAEFDAVIMIHISRPGYGSATGSMHASETAMNGYELCKFIDITIVNDGTIEDLTTKFQTVFSEWYV